MLDSRAFTIRFPILSPQPRLAAPQLEPRFFVLRPYKPPSMPRRPTSPQLAADIATLKKLKKSATLDFIQWVDSRESRTWTPPMPTRSQRANPLKAPLLKRTGYATLHNTTPRVLAGLPASVQACRLAGFELSVDLQPKGYSTDQEQAQMLVDGFNLLIRRLAPWDDTFIEPRVYIATGGVNDRHIDSAYPLVRVTPGGVKRYKRIYPNAPTINVNWPVAVGGVVSHFETIYYGHRVKPTLRAHGAAASAQAEMRVYIKTTDNSGDLLPRPLWRVRVEVTMNGVAAQATLGATTVGDLLTTNFKPLGTRYFKLACAVATVDRPPPTTPLEAVIFARLLQNAEADALAAEASGNHLQTQTRALNFVNKKALNRPIVDALRGYRQGVDRALTGRSAGRVGPRKTP